MKDDQLLKQSTEHISRNNLLLKTMLNLKLPASLASEVESEKEYKLK